MDNPVVGITGAGSIDLGARTLDIRLTPRVDVNAAGAGSTIGLANIPIPVRVYGSWSKVQFGLDSSAVQAELTARLRNEAGNQIRDQIGGEVGGIIGGIVGGGGLSDVIRPSTPEPEAPASEDAAPTEPAEDRSLEDEPQDRAIEGPLGTTFGKPPGRTT